MTPRKSTRKTAHKTVPKITRKRGILMLAGATVVAAAVAGWHLSRRLAHHLDRRAGD